MQTRGQISKEKKYNEPEGVEMLGWYEYWKDLVIAGGELF